MSIRSSAICRSPTSARRGQAGPGADLDQEESDRSGVRQYMEDVVNWAIHEGIRVDESNPFEVKRLKFALPFGIHKRDQSSVAAVRAGAGVPRRAARARRRVKARALQFVMLTAVRIADICGGGKPHSEPMKWSHVDLAGRAVDAFRIPRWAAARRAAVRAGDAIARRDAAVPRSRIRLRVSRRGSPAPCSRGTLRHMLKAMGHGGEVTTHGMRAASKPGHSETTTYEKDVIEASPRACQGRTGRCLSPGICLDKRRRLMTPWAAFLEGEAMGSVVPMRA